MSNIAGIKRSLSWGQLPPTDGGRKTTTRELQLAVREAFQDDGVFDDGEKEYLAIRWAYNKMAGSGGTDAAERYYQRLKEK